MLGETWSGWSSAGAEGDDGGGTDLGKGEVLSKRSTKGAPVSLRTLRDRYQCNELDIGLPAGAGEGEK